MKVTRFYSYRITFFIVVAVVAFLATIALYGFFQRESSSMSSDGKSSTPNDGVVRFMPIGDSYTIGLGVADEYSRWPNLLVRSLSQAGIQVELIDNPAVSGYEADDAIQFELPEFEQAKPDLGTLFIGANDSFRQKELGVFEQEYKELLDRMQMVLTNPSRLVVITIPNYAQFPAGRRYGATKSEEEVIERYNTIIRKEAEERGLKVVDLFKVNTMNSADYFISDGLHPNAKGIQVWHDAILPVVKEVLESHD